MSMIPQPFVICNCKFVIVIAEHEKAFINLFSRLYHKLTVKFI